jgi:serine/threonine-protein kinase
MTQVLAGAGVATAQTIVRRPQGLVAPPPAPPVYRAPGAYYDYEEPPRRRSVWPWLLALVLIAAGAAGGWFLYTKIQDQLDANTPVPVPNVLLLQKDLAAQHIREAGMVPKFAYGTSDTVPKDQVIAQDPSGKQVKGTTIVLTVSTGKPQVVVPNVVGQDVTAAVSSLAQLGLEPNIVRIYSAAQPDTVTAQHPAMGDKVDKGTKVRINVSRGAKPVQIPDVTGQPYANAKSALEGQGFVVVRSDIQSDQPKGVVVSMDPPAGQQVGKGTKITLAVSKGPATTTVPDVTAQNQADATSILQGAGFTVAVIYDPVNDPSQDGIVLSQDPAGGSDATTSEVITIHVGQLQPDNGNGDGDNGGGTAPTDTTTTP